MSKEPLNAAFSGRFTIPHSLSLTVCQIPQETVNSIYHLEKQLNFHSCRPNRRPSHSRKALFYSSTGKSFVSLTRQIDQRSRSPVERIPFNNFEKWHYRYSPSPFATAIRPNNAKSIRAVSLSDYQWDLPVLLELIVLPGLKRVDLSPKFLLRMIATSWSWLKD